MASSTAAAVAGNTLTPVPAQSGRAKPDGRFRGKVVLVSGATSGIGRAAAEAFAREGADVTFCGRREVEGLEVEAGIRAFGGTARFAACDVRDPLQVERLVADVAARHGDRIDIAFNNAGAFLPVKEVEEFSLDEWRDVVTTNLDGTFFALRALIPVMRRQGGGNIVVMASVAAHVGAPNTPAYVASKHGVLGLVKAVSKAQGKHNVRINSISPLAVDTPMLRASLAAQGVSPEMLAPTFSTPRIMTVDEMAWAVLMLADPRATMLNGMDLDVTGGQLV